MRGIGWGPGVEEKGQLGGRIVSQLSDSTDLYQEESDKQQQREGAGRRVTLDLLMDLR